MDRTTSWNDETAAAIIVARHREVAGFVGADDASATALLPILHALLERFGYIDPAAIPEIAGELNISRAEVHGTISFYHDFRTEPVAAHVLRLCRAESCQAMGSERLAAHMERRHGLRPGDSSPDGAVTFENVYCVGNCALSPAAMLDGEPLGRMDEVRLDQLVESLRSARR